MVQARIDTGLDWQCFPNGMAFWQGTQCSNEKVCVFLSLPPDNKFAFGSTRSLSASHKCIRLVYAWVRPEWVVMYMTLYDLILRS